MEGLAQVAGDIYQLQLPLPFALRVVNVYLLRDGEGWTVIDTGLHTDDVLSIWRRAFAALGIRPRQLQRILLTHVHPDHFGLAGWLQQQVAEDGGTARVYASAREIEQVRLIWEKGSDKSFVDYLTRHGMPEAMARAVDAGMEDTRLMTLPHPDALYELEDDALVSIGRRQWRTLRAEGHADGQMLLYDEADALLLSGDHVLMKITPNIGIWTETDPHPLARYLASLRALRGLKVRLALPGHKTLITDWAGRIDELLHHHDERLTHTLDAVRAGHQTAYDVALVIFQHMRFTPHEWRFALAEALAHLDLLAAEGSIRQHDERFTP